jgi:hypothetical protein
MQHPVKEMSRRSNSTKLGAVFNLKSNKENSQKLINLNANMTGMSAINHGNMFILFFFHYEDKNQVT